MHKQIRYFLPSSKKMWSFPALVALLAGSAFAQSHNTSSPSYNLTEIIAQTQQSDPENNKNSPLSPSNVTHNDKDGLGNDQHSAALVDPHLEKDPTSILFVSVTNDTYNALNSSDPTTVAARAAVEAAGSHSVADDAQVQNDAVPAKQSAAAISAQSMLKWLRQADYNSQNYLKYCQIGQKLLTNDNTKSDAAAQRKALIGPVSIVNEAKAAEKEETIKVKRPMRSGSFKLMRPNGESRANIQHADVVLCAMYVPFVIGGVEPTLANFDLLAQINLFDVHYPFLRNAAKELALLNGNTQLVCPNMEKLDRSNDNPFKICGQDYKGREIDWYGGAYGDIHSTNITATVTDTSKICVATEQYRTISGRCNNLQHKRFGQRQSLFRRFIPGIEPRYTDGIHAPRDLAYKACTADEWRRSHPNCYDTKLRLPNPLDISNTVMVNPDSNNGPHSPNVSHMLVNFGQFLDHDMTKTPANDVKNPFTNRAGSCIDVTKSPAQCKQVTDDPRCCSLCPGGNCNKNDFDSADCNAIARAACKTRGFSCNEKCYQFNEVTSVIDASMVYGSSIEELEALTDESPNEHLLKVSTNDLAPTIAQCKMASGKFLRADDCISNKDPNEDTINQCGACGDDRCNEHPGLFSMHTMFVRFHNNISSTLWELNGCSGPVLARNPNGCWSKSKCFEEARKIVAAAVQIITIDEFLPPLLGQQFIDAFRLKHFASGTDYETSYNSKVNTNIYAEFSGAAMRIGHTFVRLWWACDGNCVFNPSTFPNKGVFESPELQLDQFFLPNEQFDTPQFMANPDNCKRTLEGLTREPIQKSDEQLDDTLRQFLDGFKTSDDLAAININRCREMGCASYGEMAVFGKQQLNAISSGLGNQYYPSTKLDFNVKADNAKLGVLSFDDFPLTDDAKSKLKTAYGKIPAASMDLYVAGLSEALVQGGLAGPTFAHILAQQFFNAKYGDRFWWSNAPVDINGKANSNCSRDVGVSQAFTRCQLQELRAKVTMANVMCCSGMAASVTPNAFLMPDPETNSFVPCQPQSQICLDLAKSWSIDAKCTV